MSAMIDTETSVNHLVEHAANRKKLGKVQCGDVVFLVVKIVFANLRLFEALVSSNKMNYNTTGVL